jgi:hypothetical protein
VTGQPDPGTRAAIVAAAHRGFHEAWTIGEPLDLYPDSPVWLAIADAVLVAPSPAHDEAARGLKFRVEVACDGYAALTDADVPDDEFMDFDSYIAGAKAAADAIRAALTATEEPA